MATKKKKRTANRNQKRGLEVVRNQTSSDPTQLDKLIHERMRLGIISALAANESLSFSELKRLLDTSDGNISVHARKLEDAGYVVCRKSFEGRKPLTKYEITDEGRDALGRYIDHMDALIKAVKGETDE